MRRRDLLRHLRLRLRPWLGMRMGLGLSEACVHPRGDFPVNAFGNPPVDPLQEGLHHRVAVFRAEFTVHLGGGPYLSGCQLRTHSSSVFITSRRARRQRRRGRARGLRVLARLSALGAAPSGVVAERFRHGELPERPRRVLAVLLAEVDPD